MITGVLFTDNMTLETDVLVKHRDVRTHHYNMAFCEQNVLNA